VTRPIRDLAASIRQRLNNIAKERHRPAAELLAALVEGVPFAKHWPRGGPWE